MQKNIINVAAAIDFIEDNLDGRLDLKIVANGVHYSKYHLHRIFTGTVGLTVHDYVTRRRLTEAAKLLIFSDRPILEIALIAGYESQQAFTDIFKLMYKKSPKQYREAEDFYPLQLRYVLNQKPTKNSMDINWETDIEFALESDIPAWMDLVRLVVDGFPYLKEGEYLEQLKLSIEKRQALILRDENIIMGSMIFCRETGSIDFLGIHPQYRKRDIAKAFLRRVWGEFSNDTSVCITTFREGDKADPGYRELFQKLGFAEAELLTEFGYPTQRFTLRREDLEVESHE